MARAPVLPTRDRLLSKRACARLLGFHVTYWNRYYRQFTRLVRGRRYRSAKPGGKGVPRWLESAVIAHMHLDLVSQPAAPIALPPAAQASVQGAATERVA